MRHNMRVRYFIAINQLLFPLLLAGVFAIALASCRRGSEELPVVPPATYPLSREYIGFGVVNVSFAHLLEESSSTAVSLGYLRRGTVVRIIERRVIVNRANEETWVFVEGNYQGQGSVSNGWLPETALVIYDSESRANTASRTMSQ
jgi:hypothetical protein